MGEVTGSSERGRSQFYALMSRKPDCYFYAFDTLRIAGEDLRGLPLIERKAKLRKLIGRRRSWLLYVDHIEHRGSRLFAKACELDLEGIVAKRKKSLYRSTEKPSPHWIKIKNPAYSQAVGRDEFFER
jgi:bifunctional non-homologous end joining protein LigD